MNWQAAGLQKIFSDSPTSNQGIEQKLSRANIMPKIIDGSIQLN
jgi:hypothetical protein